MYVPDIEFHDVTSVEEASALLQRHAPDIRVLAGGTDLLVDLKTGRLAVGHVVGIRGIVELREISETPDGVRIGTLVTPNQLSADSRIRAKYPALLDAIGQMAATQVRNMGTVGGNIAGGVPSADLPPILVTLNASIALRSSAGERTLPLESFFLGPRQTALGENEIIASILLPAPPARFGAAYARFSRRQANSCAVAGVAASVVLDEDNRIHDVRVVLCAVAPIPKLVAEIGDELQGLPACEETWGYAASLAHEAAEPITDIRGAAEFRRHLVAVLTQRALATASTRARENC